MRYLEGVIATTHLDSHNERFSRGALESMVEQINSQYLPVGVEHDPRIPPQGRNISARLEQTDDSEYSVLVIQELFEEGDKIPLKNDGREMPVRPYDRTPTIIFDRSYRNSEDAKLLEDVANHISGKLQEERKKSSDPISILIIALGVRILGGIVDGFSNQLGSDLYSGFKNSIKKLLAPKRGSKVEHLITFRAVIKRDNYFVQVDTYLTNPRDEDFDYFLAEGLKNLDTIVLKLIEQYGDLRQCTFECKNEKMTLKFAVRKDAVPFIPTLEE